MLFITLVSFAVLFLALRWGAHRERGSLHDVLCNSHGQESDAVIHSRAEIQRLRTR